jgi:hypothetical protein
VGEAKVPAELRLGEGQDEAPAGGVDVDGDLPAVLVLELAGELVEGPVKVVPTTAPIAMVPSSMSPRAASASMT